MTRITKKPSPSWTDVKARLTDFDRANLIGLVQNLYMANQAFLHTRFAVGGDVLKPYKGNFGYGVGDGMDDLLAEYGVDD